MLLRFHLIVLILLCTTCLFAQNPWLWKKEELKEISNIQGRVSKNSESLFYVESKHWKVKTDVSLRFTAEIAMFMDVFQAKFDQLLAGLYNPKTAKVKPVLRIFAKAEDYAAKIPGGSRGYYRYQYKGGRLALNLYSYIDGQKQRNFKYFYYPILVHEGTHVALKNVIPKQKIPKWFDEGLATYFQFWDLRATVKQNKMTRYKRSPHRKRLKEIYLEEPPSLKALVDTKKWNPDNMGPIAKKNYALGESFVDFLLANKNGHRVFKSIFSKIQTGSPPFQELSLSKLQDLWHEHMRKRLRIKQ